MARRKKKKKKKEIVNENCKTYAAERRIRANRVKQFYQFVRFARSSMGPPSHQVVVPERKKKEVEKR